MRRTNLVNSMELKVLASSSFARMVKRLHAKDKVVVDQEVRSVAINPAIGEEKRGDLSGVFVCKFKLNNQETLLAYSLQPDKHTPREVTFLSVGSHENFYEQLKR